MEETSDFLKDRHLKQNPFRVPEGYFETLHKTIMVQKPDRVAPARIVPLMQRMPMLYPAIGIAASVIVAVGALTAYLTSLSPDVPLGDICNLLDTNDMYKLLSTSL